jgi:hypothetical protein
VLAADRNAATGSGPSVWRVINRSEAASHFAMFVIGVEICHPHSCPLNAVLSVVKSHAST